MYKASNNKLKKIVKHNIYNAFNFKVNSKSIKIERAEYTQRHYNYISGYINNTDFILFVDDCIYLGHDIVTF